MCLIDEEKVKIAEQYFDNHGAVDTITGRLVIGIRHLISIPAGLARMNYWRFLLYTTIGATAWHAILAGLGWYLHTFVTKDQLEDKIMEYSEWIKYIILGAVALAILFYAARAYYKSSKKE